MNFEKPIKKAKKGLFFRWKTTVGRVNSVFLRFFTKKSINLRSKKTYFFEKVDFIVNLVEFGRPTMGKKRGFLAFLIKKRGFLDFLRSKFIEKAVEWVFGRL